MGWLMSVLVSRPQRIISAWNLIPLRGERYDLIMRTDFLKTHPMALKFLDAVVSQPFRREIEALGGYNLNEVGKILEW